MSSSSGSPPSHSSVPSDLNSGAGSNVATESVEEIIARLVQPPVRVERSYVQHLKAPPEVVFPLLCPVEELRWVDGWDPHLVLAESGRAELDCTFVTGQGDEESVWVITEHDPAALRVAMVKVTPKIGVTVIRIQVEARDDGDTAARVAYQRTALSPAGEPFVRSFTEAAFELFMQRWELELNHFLRTGENLGTTS